MYDSAKIVPAVIEFVDIAGLVKGASKGEGLGNQFLSHIRETDAIVHVVRCFENTNIVHVDGSINPLRDIETINLELIFSDIDIIERRIAKVSRGARNDKALAKELGPSGIQVNAVAPGTIMTDMCNGFDKETMELIKEETPLGRIGTAEDVSNSIYFLASEQADFITGQIISPNGGMVI